MGDTKDSRPKSAYRAVVHGRVQGVGFRYSALSKALSLGLTGWVRNCRDGTVETHFEGAADKTGEFLKWLSRGPSSSRVIRVDKHAVPPQEVYRTYSIEY